MTNRLVFIHLQRMGQRVGNIKEKSQTGQCTSSMLFLEIFILWNSAVLCGEIMFNTVSIKLLNEVLNILVLEQMYFVILCKSFALS